MTPTDKAALRALAEKATPGPWKAEQAFGGFGALLTHDGALIFGLAHGTTDERFTDKEQVPHDYAYLRAAHPAAVLALLDEVERLREALKGVLARDERNTCQHEETHRGGFLWEICDSCGAKWADDEGGKPEWEDPPEWGAARAALEPRP